MNDKSWNVNTSSVAADIFHKNSSAASYQDSLKVIAEC